ncbi:MAG: hypothetical protein A2474_00725 [Elusimicrobia bacterium RIFOXYC2_FULL_34_12]|nr:MAG: hypothetical protein A2474_00725 [Elusimicrobia bacterium RIFOXYC2_FULL_34_12]
MRILNIIFDIFTIFFNLIAVESKIIRKIIERMTLAFVFIGLAFLLFLAAAFFFLSGAYQYFAMYMHHAFAAMLVSILSIVLALIFIGIAKLQIK